jgi:hypothetical protein
MWQQLIRNKYLNSKPLSQAFWKPGDSHFLAGLMKIKQDFLHFGSFTIKMDPKLVSRRTFGWAQPLYKTNNLASFT